MKYEILQIPWTLESPYSEMTKYGASEFFEWLKQNVDYRLSQLSLLVKLSGENVTLDFSRDSLLNLGYSLTGILKIRKKTEEEMKTLIESVPDWLKESVKDQDEVLNEKSLSIAFDLAIYFSQVLIKADNRIKWKMHTRASKLDADRNQLILTGTSKVRHNPIRSMQIVCFKIAKGEYESTRLYELYKIWFDSLVDS